MTSLQGQRRVRPTQAPPLGVLLYWGQALLQGQQQVPRQVLR
jgi:hypothetical protein